MRSVLIVLGLVLGLGGAFTAGYFVGRGGDGKRQAVMVTVINQLGAEKPLRELPQDCLEWLFSRAGWTPDDLGKVDDFASGVGGRDPKRLRDLEERLATTDPGSREILVKVYGENWERDAEEEKALTAKIQNERERYSERARKAVQASDPAALVMVAREWSAAVEPLQMQRAELTMRRYRERQGE